MVGVFTRDCSFILLNLILKIELEVRLELEEETGPWGPCRRVVGPNRVFHIFILSPKLHFHKLKKNFSKHIPSVSRADVGILVVERQQRWIEWEW